MQIVWRDSGLTGRCWRTEFGWTDGENQRSSDQAGARRWCYTLAESARGTSLRNAHADTARSRVRERPACLDEVLPLLGLWNATSLYVASRRGRRRRVRSGGGSGDGRRKRRRKAAGEEVEAKSQESRVRDKIKGRRKARNWVKRR